MALDPKFNGQRLVALPEGADNSTATTGPLNTIELYLDYVCPFSAKAFKTIHGSVLPRLRADPSLAGRVQFLFRQQVQPWHPSSTLVHEAALAVQRLAPARFWDFSAALFDAQTEYFDVAVVNEPRNQTYRRLAALASQSAGVSEDDVYKLLAISVKPAEDGSTNTGNAVTVDLKYTIKLTRLVGNHITPSAIFNGVAAPEFSSSWTADQFVEWVKSKAS